MTTTPPEPPLSPAAEALYIKVLAIGGVLHVSREATASEADPVHELIQVGLLGLSSRDAQDGLLLATVDPHLAADRWRAVLLEEALGNVRHIEHQTQQLASLTSTFDSMKPQRSAEPTKYKTVVGHAEINQLAGQLMASCTREILTLHPTPRTVEMLRRGLAVDLELARRPGMDYRSLYPASERNRPEVLEIVQNFTEAGARYRGLGALPGRLFLFDGYTALIDAPSVGVEDQWAACCVADPPVVAYLRALYEHLWGRAQALLDEREDSADKAGLDATQRAILRHLHDGLSHKQIGRRLHLNERTVAAHISQLKERFSVSSLFQLGAEAASRGLL